MALCAPHQNGANRRFGRRAAERLAEQRAQSYGWAMRILLLLALIWVPVTGGAGEIYRWVDEDGNVHYSDQQRDGAEKVETRPMETFEAAPVTQPASRQEAETFSYDSVRITRPEQDQIIWRAEGDVSVSVNVSPQLRPGHRIIILLDGEAVAEGSGANLGELDRGTYEVRANVMEGSDEVAASSPVTFHIRQPSRMIPRDPIRPPPSQ